MAEPAPEPIASLYVHVPFCAQKCSYCAFYSEPSGGDIINRFVAALIREMELVAADLRLRTVFFGGGTPSLLNLRQWEQILRAMDRLRLLGAGEWTVECNPATVSLDKAKLLRTFGVNRISLGIQALNDPLLERLGRVHTRQMAFRSFDILRQAGFDNLNLDLMFAIPGQTLQVWRDTLMEVTAMGSEHLSAYEVIYEEDTPLYAQLRSGQFDVDEDLACAMYDELLQHAAGASLLQYEVANFARRQTLRQGRLEEPAVKCRARAATGEAPSVEPAANDSLLPGLAQPTALPGFACQHNINYWRGGSFYGLGPSATSYVRGVRTKNWANTRIYCEQLERGRRAIESSETLPALARAGETAAFGLRMVAGWPFEGFRRITGFDLATEWAEEMTQLARRGWADLAPGNFRLTSAGLRFADEAARLFLR